MEKNEIIKMAEKFGLPYKVETVGEIEFIWIWNKNRTQYLRLSDHMGEWYGKHNGIVGYVNDSYIIEIMKEWAN